MGNVLESMRNGETERNELAAIATKMSSFRQLVIYCIAPSSFFSHLTPEQMSCSIYEAVGVEQATWYTRRTNSFYVCAFRAVFFIQRKNPASPGYINAVELIYAIKECQRTNGN